MTDRDILVKKMLSIKQRLPNQYMGKLTAKFPKYATEKGRVRKVVALQLVDEEIINALAKISL
jgi:hypothetical protein